MEKNWFTSKTIIGGGFFALVSFLTVAGIIDSNAYVEFVKWLSLAFGAYGLRDALD